MLIIETYQGFRIVSFAAAPVERTAVRELSLRDKAYWYPSVPPDDVSLNAESFTGQDSLIKRYQPLMWSRFGGPRGVYLRALTKISVSVNGRLHFHYDREDIPAHSLTLGRDHRGPIGAEQALQRLGLYRGVEFSIDGPGGEMIQTIEVAIDKPRNKNRLGDGDKVHSFRVSDIR